MNTNRKPLKLNHSCCVWKHHYGLLSFSAFAQSAVVSGLALHAMYCSWEKLPCVGWEVETLELFIEYFSEALLVWHTY